MLVGWLCTLEYDKINQITRLNVIVKNFSLSCKPLK